MQCSSEFTMRTLHCASTRRTSSDHFWSVGMPLRCRAATGTFVYEFLGYVVDRKLISVHVDFLKEDFLVLARAIAGAK